MESDNNEYIDITEEINESEDSQEEDFHISNKESHQNQNILAKNNKKGVKLHTIKSKLKIIKYAEENGRVLAREKYDIAESTLRDWIKNKKNMKMYLQISLTTLLYIQEQM